MKRLNHILMVSTLLMIISCKAKLEVETILEDKEPSLIRLVNLMVTSTENQICLENVSQQHEKISDLLRTIELDCIVKKKKETENGFNTEDSLIILTKWTTKVFRQPEYLIYDFSKSGRILEDFNLPNAAFYRKRIKGKWYAAEQGFD